MNREIMNETDGSELYRILLFNNEEEVRRVDPISNEELKQKVNEILEKKAKKMDVLNSKADDEFLKRHTFTPQTHANKGDLNFKKFLENQKEHLDKINDVVGIIKEENEEVINAEITHHPNINYKSEILFDEKIKTNQPTYLRLYNKRKHFKNATKKIIIINKIKKKNKV